MSGLSGNLVVSKDRHPDRVALRCDDLRFTFAEFHTAAARVATLLDKAGIEPGDRVGVMLPNTPAFAIALCDERPSPPEVSGAALSAKTNV